MHGVAAMQGFCGGRRCLVRCHWTLVNGLTEWISWSKYTLCLVPVWYNHHHHHWCYIARAYLYYIGTSTGEGLMGETNERSQQLSLLLQGGELVVEVDRGALKTWNCVHCKNKTATFTRYHSTTCE